MNIRISDQFINILNIHKICLVILLQTWIAIQNAFCQSLPFSNFKRSTSPAVALFLTGMLQNKLAARTKQKLAFPGHMWISNKSNLSILFQREKKGNKNVPMCHWRSRNFQNMVQTAHSSDGLYSTLLNWNIVYLTPYGPTFLRKSRTYSVPHS
jgi:hypothetical protein